MVVFAAAPITMLLLLRAILVGAVSSMSLMVMVNSLSKVFPAPSSTVIVRVWVWAVS